MFTEILMSVRVLLITHEDIGAALLKATKKTFGKLPIPAQVVAIKYNADPDNVSARLKKLAEKSDENDGFLILTDMYGSTPCNIALALKDYDVQVISGLNLPMLIRVMNYPGLNLTELAEKALSGGKDGVVNCTNEHNNECH